LRAAVPDVPEELERIVLRALALKPAERYPDASTFREDLLAFLEQTRRVSARDVGDRVAQLFAAERREINEVIRCAMSEKDDEERDVTPGQLNALHLLPTLKVLSGSTATPTANTAPTTAPVTRTPHHNTPLPVNHAMPTSERVRQKWWISALAMVAIAGLVTSAALAFRASREPRANPPLAQVPATLEARAVAPTSTIAKEPIEASQPSETTRAGDRGTSQPASTVHLDIRAEPKGARLELDGEVIGVTSYEGVRARDAAPHVLTVSAPGYRERKVSLKFDHDVALAVGLAELTSKAPAAADKKLTAKPTNHGADRPSESYVVDLPAPRRPQAPPLDTSNPW
jgi:hypothetical protein